MAKEQFMIREEYTAMERINPLWIVCMILGLISILQYLWCILETKESRQLNLELVLLCIVIILVVCALLIAIFIYGRAKEWIDFAEGMIGEQGEKEQKRNNTTD